jgi:hypothetical protein
MAEETESNRPSLVIVAVKDVDEPRTSVSGRSSWRLPTISANAEPNPLAHRAVKHNLQMSPMNKPGKHDTDTIESITITRSSAQLIDEHLQEIQVRADGHAKAALRYEKRDRILGYPVTLMSSFLASTLMMGITQSSSSNSLTISYVSLGLSVVSFVLSLSRDYLKYTNLFQAHDISSKLYTNLLRSIEVRLIGNHITPDDRRDMFKDIIDQMSIIEQYEHAIPSDINRKVRSEMFVPRSVVINKTLLQEASDRKK